jgi:hypothetical protein
MNIPELNITLTSVEVKSKTRKLSCDFSRQMAKDIQYFRGFEDTSYQRINRMAAIINIFNIKET